MQNTITLSNQQIEIIYLALGELPLKIAGPVFGAIQGQMENLQTFTANYQDPVYEEFT